MMLICTTGDTLNWTTHPATPVRERSESHQKAHVKFAHGRAESLPDFAQHFRPGLIARPVERGDVDGATDATTDHDAPDLAHEAVDHFDDEGLAA